MQTGLHRVQETRPFLTPSQKRTFTEEWFQVFVQKVVRRVGIEVMSFFAALLESQLY